MNNVFNKKKDLTVSFQSLQRDLVQRAREKLLSQFHSKYPLPSRFKKYREDQIREYLSSGITQDEAEKRADEDLLVQRDLLIEKVQSPVLAQVMNAIGEEFDEFYQAALQVLIGRTLQQAEGINLDIIGDIVGVSRTLYDFSSLPWLETDSANSFNPDYANAWVTGVRTFGDMTMNDREYRRAILAQIFKNHSSFASLPEIRSFAEILLGYKISFCKTGYRELTLVCPAGTPVGIIRYLTTKLKTKNISSSYVLPLPPTVKIRDDVFFMVAIDSNGRGCSFATDQYAGRPDYAKSTLTVDTKRRLR